MASADRLRLLKGHLQAKPTMASGSPLTTHVLDTAKGRPAQNVPITLFRQTASTQWQHLSSGMTNADGRCPNIISKSEFVSGRYKLTFDTCAYFRQNQQTGFYPYVDVVFEISDPDVHYHVPLLLSPFGNSSVTWRNSSIHCRAL
ncbi:5-hydroxyisourate hydrolase [Lamellibrachia satsuma]|nr:5-hydroxyisourate hydrolase [Lamellibrachia satsuma]